MKNFGDYEIICEIGCGGMAQVFKAKQNDLKRTVAIKKIKEGFSEDENFLRMFKDEAVIAANLNHPNITSIYELGRLGNSYYISMEYVDGESLKKIVERLRASNEMIPLNLSLFIVSEVAKALQFAHRLNVIHRDISPSNILISYEGRVKLADFGIAKAEHFISASTKVGILKGKVNYLTPEQVRGEKVDCRTDIFALGIIMYELISGKTLFTGETELEILEKVRNSRAEDVVSSIIDVPVDLKSIMSKCLQESREKRYQDISSFIIDVESVVHNHGLLSDEEELSVYLNELFERINNNQTGTVAFQPSGKDRKENRISPEIIYQTRITKGTGIVNASQQKGKNIIFITLVSAVFIFFLIFLINGQKSLREDITDVKPRPAKNKYGNVRQAEKSRLQNVKTSAKITGGSAQVSAPPITGNEKNVVGTIFINVQPSDASVYIDNDFQGEGNKVMKNLKPGEHIVKIVHPDYEDEIRLVKITSQNQKIYLLYRNGEITEHP